MTDQPLSRTDRIRRPWRCFLPKWFRAWHAKRFGYFWIPCPLCGEMMSGIEWDGRSIPGDEPNTGKGVCWRHYLGRSRTLSREKGELRAAWSFGFEDPMWVFERFDDRVQIRGRDGTNWIVLPLGSWDEIVEAMR